MSSATQKKSTHPFQTDDPRLSVIHEKVVAQQLLDAVEVASLYASRDILAIGWLANLVRERMHGDATRYSVDSIVVSQAAQASGCALCGRPPQTVDVAAQVESTGGNVEELIVLNNAEKLDSLYRSIETLKKNVPQARIFALTVEEITTHREPTNVCASLRQAGADGLIGAGAESFLPALRHRLWHHAGTAEKRAEVRQAALAAGLDVPRFMVQRSGNAAGPQQQAEELLSFRGRPADSFAALSFDPDAGTSLNVSVTTGMQEMKQIAIARLALDNVKHIRAYWAMLGGKLLQIALRFGASDLDGTPLEIRENLDERKTELAPEIKVAGREPQEIPNNRKLVLLA
jgi:aminodeoxyfutalosine synthase